MMNRKELGKKRYYLDRSKFRHLPGRTAKTGKKDSRQPTPRARLEPVTFPTQAYSITATTCSACLLLRYVLLLDRMTCATRVV
jgi:hypothetical protein